MTIIMMTMYAAASLYWLTSKSEKIRVVTTFHRAEIKKITALTAVIDRTNEYTRPEKNAPRMSGSVMSLKVWKLFAPKDVEASSIEGSIWARADIPPSIPTGMFLNTKTAIRMTAVPVSKKGFALKARM